MTTSNVAPTVCVPVEPEWLAKALADTDLIGPAAHFHYEEEVIQTRVLRALAKHNAPAPQPVQGEAVQVAAPGDVEQHIEALRRMLADEYSFDEGSSPIFTQERAALGAAIAALRSQGQADAARWKSIIAGWQARAESAGYRGVEDALEAAIDAALRSQGQDAVVTEELVARFIEVATERGFLGVRGTAVKHAVRSLLTAALAQQANKPRRNTPAHDGKQ